MAAAVNDKINWEDALLTTLNAPHTSQNYQFFNAWAHREQGHFSSTASGPHVIYANNPFFTTAGGGGSADGFKPGTYPKIVGGVAGYPSIDVGIVATAATLQQSPYKPLLEAIRSGNPSAYANDQGFQDALKTWSGSGYSGLNVSSAASVALGPNTASGGGAWVDVTGNGGGVWGGISAELKALSQDRWHPGGAQGPAGKALGSLSSIGDFIGFVTSIRFVELIGGFALIIIGLVLLGREVGIKPPMPIPNIPMASARPA